MQHPMEKLEPKILINEITYPKISKTCDLDRMMVEVVKADREEMT